VERDLAVVLGWEIKWAEIRDEISKVDKLIKEVRFLSEYPLADKKSLALRVVYQADDRTLKDDEIEKVEQKILDKLKKKFAAELRAEFKA
jgi:phenylalanyl-tRNA synthetase beta chain